MHKRILDFAVYCLLIVFTGGFFSCKPSDKPVTKFSVFQINIWQEGTMVPDGFNGIVDRIAEIDADVVFLSEIRNYNNTPFIPRLLNTLEEKGITYYGDSRDIDVGILAKYPLENVEIPFVLPNGSRPILKASIQLPEKRITLYSAHLDYTHYECYMPRGYSGTTWKKMDKPVLDPDSILAANRLSFRDEAIRAFLTDAQKEREKGNWVILSGDFNEPSHLDWQADTKDIWEHNGVVVNWDCSVLLQEAGYIDTYRQKYPSAVTHPGFTFPSANPAADISQLAWAPEVDERDRIDFIYYYPMKGINLEKAAIVGPSETIIRGVQVQNDASDKFMEPGGLWPTDHKATYAQFNIYAQ